MHFAYGDRRVRWIVAIVLALTSATTGACVDQEAADVATRQARAAQTSPTRTSGALPLAATDYSVPGNTPVELTLRRMLRPKALGVRSVSVCSVEWNPTTARQDSTMAALFLDGAK